MMDEAQKISDEIKRLKAKYDELVDNINRVIQDENIALKTVTELQDESTAELEANIADIEEINRKVRANLDKEKAEEDAQEYSRQYNTLTTELNNVRQAKIDLLKGANLPLPGLSVEDGELTYNGHKWIIWPAQTNSKWQAIVRKLNPNCGFVLMDKLEQMDLDTLTEFGQWLEQEALQVIATRVSTGEECSIIIEDGYSVSTIQYQATEEQLKQAAEFKAAPNGKHEF